LYFAWVFAPHLGLIGTLVLSALGFYLAVLLCGEAEVRLGKQDPGEVILDEFVAMPLCFLGWPRFLEVAPFWFIVLVGFGLFRLFDIWKPLGIAKLQALPGGWGVVVDDTAAALVSCAVMHLGCFAWVHFRG
jgi:phosphatidylglycerophosphatase A